MTIPYEVDTDNQLAALVLTAEELEVLEAVYGGALHSDKLTNPLYNVVVDIRKKLGFGLTTYVLKNSGTGKEVEAFIVEKMS